MFEPSKAGKAGPAPTVTVWRIWPAEPSLSRVPALTSVPQPNVPSKTAPVGAAKPAVTVVTVHVGPTAGVMIETEAPWFAVQTRTPSKAMPSDWLPRLVATAVTAPAGMAGSMRYSAPGLVEPATRTQPSAATASLAVRAPVQVSRSLPSPARTRETSELPRLGTQRSLPSERTLLGPDPTVVSPRTKLFGVQNWLSAARRPPRSRTPSTVRERNAAIWRRVTELDGS